MTIRTCGRCNTILSSDAEHKVEGCWFCPADLCVECWEKHGHCGHPEADAMNAEHSGDPDKKSSAQLAAIENWKTRKVRT